MEEETGSRGMEEYVIEKEPYYLPSSNEIEVFTRAYENRLPVLL